MINKNSSSLSMNFTNHTSTELQIDADKSIVITRRISKPNRRESLLISYEHIRQRQKIRFETYSNRIQNHHLYSIRISSDGIQCYGINCQPSVFNSIYRCRKIISNEDLLMNEQDLKETMSYTSLMDLTNLIDHEPNVSRRNSFLHSKSNQLMTKPSSFIIDIFKKMTHEQRTRSIADLVQFHENLKMPQRTISLPDFNEQLTKLESITSLTSERTKANMILIENDQSQSPIIDLKDTSSPIKLISLSRTNSPSTINYPYPTFIRSSSSNPSIESKKSQIIQSTHDLDEDLVQLNSIKQSHSSNSIITPITSQKPLNIDNSLNDVTDKLSQTSVHSQVKPVLTLIDDGDTSMITRLTTASTNLTAINDDEQSKRNSLGLARDSLELLRQISPHEPSIDEQLKSDRTPHQRKSVLKSRFDSSDYLSTPEFISYIAIDDVKGDKQLIEQQVRRRSLTLGGSTIISCTSPKPKRDSLILNQERYSGSTTPHHLINSDGKHVEFIRQPGDTITPVLHLGRGIKSKHSTNKSIGSSSSSSSSSANEYFTNHLFNLPERSKSENSLTKDNQQRNSSDKICFSRSDYEKIVQLILNPSTKTKEDLSSNSSNCLSTYFNSILLILVICFYIYLFLKN